MIREGDLVLLRLSNDTSGRRRYYNTWFRVISIDRDTFVGECERHDYYDFTLCKKGDYVKLDIDRIQHVYKEGEQFCYGDDITICDCKGLCRNK